MEARVDSTRKIDQDVGYTSNWEHLSEELRHLDLMIRLHVQRQQNRHLSNPWEQLKGVVLTDEEISNLLAKEANPLAAENPLPSDYLETQEFGKVLGTLRSNIEERRSISLARGVYLSLPHLSKTFNLTPFEEQCLLICLAPELDLKYEKLYAYLQDDIMRKKPSVGLALNLLCHTVQEKHSARLLFDPQAPLQKYRLLQMTESLAG